MEPEIVFSSSRLLLLPDDVEEDFRMRVSLARSHSLDLALVATSALIAANNIFRFQEAESPSLAVRH